MTKKLYAIVKTISIIQDCLFDIAKRLEKLEKERKDYATISSIKKNNPKLYNAYIEREKAND
tara:strand:+ start:237 stop:422 length:186 start_codon:yes stop_codon:yes gene_type:complete